MAITLPKTLYSIQVLRAIAAASVVVYHTLIMLVHNGGYSFSVPNIGASGVDLFFVISGFIMIFTSYTVFGKPQAPLLFLRRRLIRIVPIYWLYTTIAVLLLAFIPSLFSTSSFNWTHVISSYFFLLSKSSTGEVGTVLQTGWTLCFEIYFYLIFAILLLLSRHYFLAISGFIFVIGTVFISEINQIPVWATVATNPILFEFYLGAVIAFLFVKGVYFHPILAVFLIICGIAAIVITNGFDFGQWTRLICWGIPASVILFGFISLEHTRVKYPRILVSLGDSSYSLYLIHPFVLPVLGKIWLILHLSNIFPPVILFLIAFFGALIAGHLSYLLIEKPLIRWVSIVWKKPLSSELVTPCV